jgi:hypothetical protein
VRDQLVANRHIKDLPKAGERLVDRAVAQRPFDGDLLAFADLCGLVSIGLLRRDLREAVVLEERQQVVGKRELVVFDRPWRQLVAQAVQPL